LTEGQSEVALQAIELGAAEVISKPKIGVKRFLEESLVQISDAIRAAYAAGVKRPKLTPRTIPPRHSADVVLSAGTGRAGATSGNAVIVVGASTGGTEALRLFLEAMPHDTPGIVIVQHMPEHFTKAFARRLNSTCTIEVKEAENRDAIKPGRALIAPGNHHIMLKSASSGYFVEVVHGPLVNRHRPSVDVLFRSAARYAGSAAVGVIMTGMGDDGAAGMDEMHQQGSVTLAQDEATCVVFGMPKEAIDRGAVSRVLPIHALAPAALAATRTARSKAR
jgi:two-component system chemotaxis response regulator CheB